MGKKSKNKQNRKPKAAPNNENSAKVNASNASGGSSATMPPAWKAALEQQAEEKKATGGGGHRMSFPGAPGQLAVALNVHMLMMAVNSDRQEWYEDMPLLGNEEAAPPSLDARKTHVNFFLNTLRKICPSDIGTPTLEKEGPQMFTCILLNFNTAGDLLDPLVASALTDGLLFDTVAHCANVFQPLPSKWLDGALWEVLDYVLGVSTGSLTSRVLRDLLVRVLASNPAFVAGAGSSGAAYAFHHLPRTKRVFEALVDRFRGTCSHCNKPELLAQLHQCSACRKVRYCSKLCQKAAWKSGHKAQCQALAEERITRKAERASNPLIDTWDREAKETKRLGELWFHKNIFHLCIEAKLRDCRLVDCVAVVDLSHTPEPTVCLQPIDEFGADMEKKGSFGSAAEKKARMAFMYRNQAGDGTRMSGCFISRSTSDPLDVGFHFVTHVCPQGTWAEHAQKLFGMARGNASGVQKEMLENLLAGKVHFKP